MESTRITDSSDILILGCPLPPATLRAWQNHFAPSLQPFFITPALADSIGLDGSCTRAQFARSAWPLSLHDTFATYEVTEAATQVVLLDHRDFSSLEADVRAHLLWEQVEAGRGGVFRLTDWASELTSEERRRLEKSAAEGIFVWWRDEFDALSEASKIRVITRFVSEDRQPCKSRHITSEQWRQISQTLPGVQKMSGTFLPASGPNCLSTVVQAFERTGETGERLERGTFETWLSKRHAITISGQGAGTILVWRDSLGRLVHTTVSLGDGLVFHKEAQTWWTPRQVVDLETALARWQEFGPPQRLLLP